MVGTHERQAARSGGNWPEWWTLGRVAYWVEHWRTLEELASPSAPAIGYDRIGSVPEGMRIGDHLRYTDALADLDRARAYLGRSRSGQRFVVDAMAGEPLDWPEKWDYLEVVAATLGVRYRDADQAWREGCEAMALWLGWDPGIGSDKRL